MTRNAGSTTKTYAAEPDAPKAISLNEAEVNVVGASWRGDDPGLELRYRGANGWSSWEEIGSLMITGWEWVVMVISTVSGTARGWGTGEGGFVTWAGRGAASMTPGRHQETQLSGERSVAGFRIESKYQK